MDAYSVDGAGGTTEYDYSDSIANPAFGSLTAAGGSVTLANGESATLTATVVANSAIAGRTSPVSWPLSPPTARSSDAARSPSVR